MKNQVPFEKIFESFFIKEYRDVMAKYIHRRNIRFKNEIGIADKKKMLGVAIDPSSNFHRVIVFDFLGKIIGKPFSIDTLRSGYELLIEKAHNAQRRIGSTNSYIAIESAGSYSENLVNHLQSDFKNVVLIPPTAVANNRKQQSLQGLKTDDIDCGAIGDLLIRGEFFHQKPEVGLYYKLRNLIYWREKKVVLTSILKNQIADRLRKIYPGVNSDFEDRKKLYTKTKSDYLYQGLLNNCMTGQEILRKSEVELKSLYDYQCCGWGRRQIKSLKKRFGEMLLPAESIATIQLNILKRDIKLLRDVENELFEVEVEIVELGRLTPAKYLMGQIKGITDLYASMYVGMIGDIRKYKTAGHIYSKSGLSPKTQQSGSSNLQSIGIKRAGNALLRSLLFKMAGVVIICEPVFMSYLKRLKEEKKRHWKKNRIAVCRKLNNVLFALIRDQSQFRR